MHSKAIIGVLLIVGLSATFAPQAVIASNVTDQYTEVIPTPGGNGGSQNPSDKGGSNGNGSSNTTDSTSGVTTEDTPGTSSTGTSTDGTGQSAADKKSEANGKKSKAKKNDKSGQKDKAKSDVGGKSDSGTAVANSDDTESSGLGTGMGIWFPLVLIVSTGIVAAVIVMRRRNFPEVK
ncbi:MAG: hypothetical protein WBW44_06655 [Solirubrobacterales bacterium]